MKQHSRMPVLVLTWPDRQVIPYDYPKSCSLQSKLQLFSLSPCTGFHRTMTVPEQNGKDQVWFLLQVAEDTRPMHALEFCHSWAACLKMKLWPYGNRVHCLPEGTSWWFLPWLSHCSPAQRLSGEALSFLLDQGGRLPEGLSHLLQETCSAWYKTTGWELISPGTNGNFDVHNSGLGCHWKACGQ